MVPSLKPLPIPHIVSLQVGSKQICYFFIKSSLSLTIYTLCWNWETLPRQDKITSPVQAALPTLGQFRYWTKGSGRGRRLLPSTLGGFLLGRHPGPRIWDRNFSRAPPRELPERGGTWMRTILASRGFPWGEAEGPAIFWSIRDLIFPSCSGRKPANQTQK